MVGLHRTWTVGVLRRRRKNAGGVKIKLVILSDHYQTIHGLVLDPDPVVGVSLGYVIPCSSPEFLGQMSWTL